MDSNFNEFGTLLSDLIKEHRDLDKIISESMQGKVCTIELQQLKRRKLHLKDQISQIESIIYPNIIA
jgi:hypothetical protein